MNSEIPSTEPIILARTYCTVSDIEVDWVHFSFSARFKNNSSKSLEPLTAAWLKVPFLLSFAFERSEKVHWSISNSGCRQQTRTMMSHSLTPDLSTACAESGGYSNQSSPSAKPASVHMCANLRYGTRIYHAFVRVPSLELLWTKTDKSNPSQFLDFNNWDLGDLSVTLGAFKEAQAERSRCHMPSSFYTKFQAPGPILTSSVHAWL